MSYKHFRERLKERYQLDISVKEYDAMCVAPNLTDVFTVEPQKDDTQLIALMMFKKKQVMVVYSFKKKCFTTALPIVKRKLIR